MSGWARRLLAGVLGLVAVVSCAGFAATAQPAAPAAKGDFAGLVDVDGRKIYLECRGSGSPTVVLQSGFGNGADVWSLSTDGTPAVAPAVAEFTRVCAYDRPGSTRVLADDGSLSDQPRPARSDPAPMPRTAADVTRRAAYPADHRWRPRPVRPGRTLPRRPLRPALREHLPE